MVNEEKLGGAGEAFLCGEVSYLYTGKSSDQDPINLLRVFLIAIINHLKPSVAFILAIN